MAKTKRPKPLVGYRLWLDWVLYKDSPRYASSLKHEERLGYAEEELRELQARLTDAEAVCEALTSIADKGPDWDDIDDLWEGLWDRYDKWFAAKGGG